VSFTAALKHLGIDTMVFVDPRANAWLYRRDPRPLAPFDLVLARSRHVLASLRAAGIDRVHPQPLYAVAQLDLFGAGSGPLRARSRYDWLEALASAGPGRVAASS
jgi:hypothetical protein